MKAIKAFLQNTLFIKNGTCPICDKVLFSHDHYCCPTCFRALPLNHHNTCRSCGRGLSDQNKKTCSRCLEENYPFAGGYAHYHYDQGAKRLVAALKFKNRPNLGIYLGGRLDFRTCPWISEIDLIMPIPIHPKRLKDRGYNQSLYISQGILEGLQARGQEGPGLSRALVRRHNSPHQVGLSRDERATNIIGAFDLLDPRMIEGKKILLVDDVLTTGATLGEAANSLIEGGAGAVYLAVLAALNE